ncbi:MAG: PQQ-binding-like beta-propeller repeat protein [Sphingopyxis sp.]|uniref:outer membrane protein assembly factor BamB family protein n=1 Tax=Sphingopyxis sp. TaxID=1908224 RepID=UPI002ABBBF1A|nr:PQQ-binding-like beta-propeller repeat protein [Sphingopyxis sp.]MDZ3830580.1 PQQ-binding-like beta-propeller repeat protein [Sphingopyxis sp.]
MHPKRPRLPIARRIRTLRGKVIMALLLFFGLGVPAAAHAAPGELLWDFRTDGQIWSPPTHDRGTLYFGSDDGHIYALDTRSRALKWKFATGGKVRSKPAVDGDLVVAASDDGYLYALDRSSGAQRWRFSLESHDLHRRLPALSNPYYDFLHSSPLIHQGQIFIGSLSGTLFVIDAALGKLAWQYGTGDAIRSTPVVADGRLYFGSWDDHVYAIDLATKTLAWRTDSGGIVQSTPAIGDGKLVVGSRSAKLIALDTQSGTEAWHRKIADDSWIESSATFADDRFYVGSSDSLVVSAHAASDGRELWAFKTGGWTWATPRIAKGTLYIGGMSAFPYYFDGVTLTSGFFAVDAETGREKWRFVPETVAGYVTGGVAVAPEIADGVVYVAALDGRLYALRE